MANLKSQRIQEILIEVEKRFNGYTLDGLRTWSSDRIIDELTTLKGVGLKTASCVCVFSLGRDLFPVDTHVHRLCTRLGLVEKSRTPEETFRQMKGMIPSGKGYSFHTNLIRFGRKICRSSNPACNGCPLFSICTYTLKTQRKAGSTTADHSFMVLENLS